MLQQGKPDPSPQKGSYNRGPCTPARQTLIILRYVLWGGKYFPKRFSVWAAGPNFKLVFWDKTCFGSQAPLFQAPPPFFGSACGAACIYQ